MAAGGLAGDEAGHVKDSQHLTRQRAAGVSARQVRGLIARLRVTSDRIAAPPTWGCRLSRDSLESPLRMDSLGKSEKHTNLQGLLEFLFFRRRRVVLAMMAFLTVI